MLETMGWSAHWNDEFTPYADSGLLAGRVISEHRSHYRVATDTAELTAEAPGRIRNAAAQRSDLPGVGDFVALRPAAGDGPATIVAVLPRISALIRKASGKESPQLLAANIDFAFIVTAMDGDFNVPRLERYLDLVRLGSVAPVIVLNKADLTTSIADATHQLAGISAGVPIHAVSARAGQGIPELEQYFHGNRTIGLIGSSGVGKSTLTNQLLGRTAQATQEVRAYDNRGRHTTTHRQLFTRPQGGSIIDTPGMRGLELMSAPTSDEDKFNDIETLSLECRFRNCRHEREPGCAVTAAVARGEIDADHLASFIKLARARHRS
jgi:ribosome biogenesis GTPase